MSGDMTDVVAERAGMSRAVVARALSKNRVAVWLLSELAIKALSHVEAVVDLVSAEDRAKALRAVVDVLAKHDKAHVEDGLLVRFRDGTTEMRPTSAPFVVSLDEPPRPPHAEDCYYIPDDEEEAGEWWFCGRNIGVLASRRTVHSSGTRWIGTWVWRITAGLEEKAPLVGRWEEVVVESYSEQVRRLAAEVAALRAGSTDCEHEPGETRCRRCRMPFRYCPGCSETGGAHRGVYHAGPLCETSEGERRRREESAR